MQQFEVLDYLRSKGLEVFRAAGKELTLQCVFCGEQHRKGKLYVNSETGVYQCKVCGAQGGLRMLLEHFGDQIDDDDPALRPSRRLDIQAEYLAVAEKALWANAAMLDHLRERGLSDETIRKARFGYHPRGTSLIEAMPNVGRPGGYARSELRETGLLNERGDEFLEGKIVIPYLASKQVVQLRGKDPEGKYVTPPGDHVRLYNADALRGAELVLQVEGEFDCRIVEQVLSTAPDVRARKIAVVGLAGAESLPDGREGYPRYFEDAKRLYVGLDPDDTGRRAALKIRDLLGSKARLVDIPDPADWTDWLAPESTKRPHGGHGWQDVMRLITEADMRDKRVYTVREAALKLVELETARPGIRLGWQGLDALLKPGLRPGSVTVPLARTGVGKSIALANIAWYNVRRPQLFITMELTAAETYNRLRRIARFWHPEKTEEQLQALFDNLRLVDENNLRSEEISTLIDEFVEDVGVAPEIVHVDYLGYFARSQRGKDQYERVTNAIMELKRLAKEHETAVIVPSQVNRGAKPGEPISEDDARDAGAVEETSDFLLGIYRPWEATQDQTTAGHVHADTKIKILKSRHGNKNRVAGIAMSHASLVMVDPSDRRAMNRVEMENAAHNRGVAYEDIYRRDHEDAMGRLQGSLAITKEDQAWDAL